MAITSINISRTSFNMQSLSLLDSLRQNTLNLFLQQNQLASGSKLNAPSDDPVAAGQATQLTELLARQNQILANIQHADTFLSTTDSTVGELSDLLTQAQSIASEMANSTADQSQRDSMAELVQGIMNQLVTVGNRTYGGVYLFGGQQISRTPFTQTHGGVEYQGDQGALTAHVDLFQDPQVNLTGADLFGALTGKVNGHADLDPALTRDTRLADVAGVAGNGVSKGLMRISVGAPATMFTVDLKNADTVGDVVDMINAGAAAAGLTVGPGAQFNAAINPAGNGLQLTAGAGNVTVEDLSEGTTARDLGIRGMAVGALNGGDVNARVTPMTTVASLFGGAGAVLGSISITNGSLSQTVDLSRCTTVQDILNKINGAGVEAQAQINQAGTGIDVVNLMSGMEMRIGENGGNTASLLGIRSLFGGTRLSDLNNGGGVDIRQGQNDLTVVARNGAKFDVSLEGSVTVQDVIDKINAAATTAGVAVTASLATTGNGIRLVDATGGAGNLSVQRADGSAAIDGLGLNKSVSGNELVGDDVNGVKPDSVFSALMDLYNALVGGGPQVEQNVTSAGEKIKGFIDDAARTRGMIGARSQAMTTRVQMTQDAVLATQSLLSGVKDVDYTEAITRFQQAQMALQANLQTGASLMQLSLLNYL